ncbi:MAG: hypothetical protein ACQEUY_04775 [Pseudomonadota bacterium]
MFHRLEQNKMKCSSILTNMKNYQYLKFVEKVYMETGGISGQRAPLKTKTAITIRDRMVKDIADGAILPPIVIGIFINGNEWKDINASENLEDLLHIIGDPSLGRVSIIDGMQRTTAIFDAQEHNPDISDKDQRVEFWISDSINSLIYRMLVLNTGQVPWEVSRQLNTIYSPLLKEIKLRVNDEIEVFEKSIEQKRRTKAGQFQSDNIIQLLLHFSSRKSELDLKDQIAEDFARLDMIESASHSHFLDQFVETIYYLYKLDKEFSRFEAEGEQAERLSRFKEGRAVFKSFPAMVGFCVAMSIYLYDEPGFDVDWEKSGVKQEELRRKLDSFLIKIGSLNKDELMSFLDLENLELILSKKTTQVGRFERRFFTEAFLVLFEKTERLNSLTPCWMKARD